MILSQFQAEQSKIRVLAVRFSPRPLSLACTQLTFCSLLPQSCLCLCPRCLCPNAFFSRGHQSDQVKAQPHSPVWTSSPLYHPCLQIQSHSEVLGGWSFNMSVVGNICQPICNSLAAACGPLDSSSQTQFDFGAVIDKQA